MAFPIYVVPCIFHILQAAIDSLLIELREIEGLRHTLCSGEKQNRTVKLIKFVKTNKRKKTSV